MLERLGIRDRYELAVFACLLLLVAVTPLGKEASHPIVFAISRTLLLFIIMSYTAWTDRSRLPRISTAFLGAAIGVATLASIASAGGPGDSLTGLVDGFNHGFLVAGTVAALVAAVAAFALPSVRPEPGSSPGACW